MPFPLWRVLVLAAILPIVSAWSAKRSPKCEEMAAELSGLPQNLTKPAPQKRIRVLNWNRQQVVDLIRMVAESKDPKIPMNSTSFGKQNSQAIKQLTGVSGSRLMELALEHISPSWDGVLEAMDLNVLETKKHIVLTPEQFATAVRALEREGIPVHGAAIQDDQSDASRAIIKKAIGSGITGAQVYWSGFSQNGRDWTKALRAAKLDPELIERRHHWDPADMITTAQTLYREKVPLNVLSLFDPSFADHIWEHCGIRVNGGTFYRAACNRFGSWDNFLRAAKLDPTQIRRHFWRRGNLSTIPTQIEVQTDAAGNFGLNRLVGKSAPEPWKPLVEQDNWEILMRKFITNVSKADRVLASRILDEILGEGRLMKAEDVAANLNQDPKKVREILDRIGKSEIFAKDD